MANSTKPKKTSRNEQYVSEEGVWLVSIETKEIKPSRVPYHVFIWAVDNAGNESEVQTHDFKITAPVEPASKAAAKRGTIKGKVVLEQSGGSPRFDQVTVSLKENKPNGATKKTTRATTEGSFEFKDVPMGSYIVFASGAVIGTTKEGTSEVVLEPAADDPSKPPVEEVPVKIGRPKPPMAAPPKPM